jgi:hypothetical protein
LFAYGVMNTALTFANDIYPECRTMTRMTTGLSMKLQGQDSFPAGFFRKTGRFLAFCLIGLSMAYHPAAMAAASVSINNYNATGTITVVTDQGDLFNVRAVDPGTLDGVDPANFPAGLVYFEVTASSANVQVLFSGIDVAQMTYYKHTSAFPGEAPRLRDFSARSQVQGDGWLLTLNEGGFGDLTGNDQLIVDPGGPRLSAAPPPQPPPSPPPLASAVPVPLSPMVWLLLSLLLLGIVVLRHATGEHHEKV